MGVKNNIKALWKYLQDAFEMEEIEAGFAATIEGFEYKNPGYELHLTGLPEEELVFTLCSEKKTIYTGNNYIGVRHIISIVLLITLLTILIIKKKKH